MPGATFGVEARHGFNKTTPALFATDLLKTLALTAALGGPCLALFIKIVMVAGPRNLAVYVGAFFVLVSTFFVTIYPVVVQPLLALTRLRLAHAHAVRMRLAHSPVALATTA